MISPRDRRVTVPSGVSTSSAGHAAPTNHTTQFKRTNTVDSATIKENTARLSAAAASRAAAAAAGGGEGEPTSLPSPAGKPRGLPKPVSSAPRTIGPSGGRRLDATRPSSASTAESRTPAQVASDLR